MTQQKLPKLVQETLDWYINQEYLKEWKEKMLQIHYQYHRVIECHDYYCDGTRIILRKLPHLTNTTIIDFILYNYRRMSDECIELQILNTNRDIVSDRLSPNYLHQKLYP